MRFSLSAFLKTSARTSLILLALTNASFGQEFLKDILTKSPGPLSNPHQSLDALSGCVECHQNRLGGEVANNKCLTCHTDIKERLEGNRGYHKEKTDCATCHEEHKGRAGNIFAPQNWLRDFDHLDTGYELLGKHQNVDCRDCHTTYRQNEKTKIKTETQTYLNAATDCSSCHKNVYEHKFSKQEWTECSLCHSSGIESWKKLSKKMRFDHDETDYTLEGLHQNVACVQCHQPDKEKKRVLAFAPKEFNQCTDCHEDVHDGKFGKDCQSCHSVYRKWKDLRTAKDPSSAKKLTSFDHSKTDFPLVGYHQAVACESCHTNPKDEFKMADDRFNECSDCHGFAHGVQFADQKCADCHQMEKKFQEPTFDRARHNKTDFPLTGKHQVLDCNKCHWAGQFEEIPSAQCNDCHRNPHDQRQIEKECSFCHVTTSFSWIQFDHNKQTDFRITGKHREVACLSCHVDQVFKNMPASNANPNCQGCHADPHGASMSNDCQSCHATEGFKLVQNFDHQKLFGWPLSGRHAELSCQKCHSEHLSGNYKIPTKTTGLLATACANCHVDVHAGKYGTACESCHTSQSFGVEYGAKVHDLGFFKLEGAHDQMGCTDCHRPETNLQGVGINCVWCHEKTDVHLGKMGPECGDCHRQTAWIPPTFKHNTTGFRLTGAHRYVECSSCHVNQIYQGLPSDCYFCHSDSKLTGVTAHAAGFIQECSDCHSTTSWSLRRGGGLQ